MHLRAPVRLAALLPLVGAWGLLACGVAPEPGSAERRRAEALCRRTLSAVYLRARPSPAGAKLAPEPLGGGTELLVLGELDGDAYRDGSRWSEVRVTRLPAADGRAELVGLSGFVASAYLGACLAPPLEPGVLALGQDFAGPDLLAPVTPRRALPESFFARYPDDLIWIPARYLRAASTYGTADLRLRASALGAFVRWAGDPFFTRAGRVLRASWVDGDNAAYRSLETQRALYAHYGASWAARPGCSEHHLGTAIDIAVREDGARETDPAILGELVRTARAHGFIQSFPPGSEEQTGIRPEWWHFRYVGRAAATQHALRGSLPAPLFVDGLTRSERATLEAEAYRDDAAFLEDAVAAWCAERALSTCFHDPRARGKLLDCRAGRVQTCEAGCVEVAGGHDRCAAPTREPE